MEHETDYGRHTAAAEQLLASAAETKRGSIRERYLVDAAQVHATLALAAATREPWDAVKDRIKERQELDAAYLEGRQRFDAETVRPEPGTGAST